MKTLITIAALLLTFNAHADETKRQYCADSVGVMLDAKHYRDNGDSPEFALARTAAYVNVPQAKRKEFIYFIYFSPAFAHVSNEKLQLTVMKNCMGWDK